MKILSKVGIDFTKYDEIETCFKTLQNELNKIDDTKAENSECCEALIIQNAIESKNEMKILSEKF